MMMAGNLAMFTSWCIEVK